MAKSIAQDLRFALRSLIKNPGFSVISILLLSLGIAATASIFSVVGAVLLQDLPYENPERLVSVRTVKDNAGTLESFPTSYLDFIDWRDGTTQFESLALYSNPESFNLASDGNAQRIDAELVSANYFEMLGISPTLGRTFTAEEDKLGGAQRVVILSHGLWQRMFSGDTSIGNGSTLLLNGESFLILGVMPQGFRGLTDGAEAWLPVMLGPELLVSNFAEMRIVRMCNVIGRLKPTATIAETQDVLRSIAADQAASYPDSNKDLTVQVKALSDAWFGDMRFRLLTLLGSAVLVLIISCTNVANLLMARAASRKTEFALRTALGAGRGRLVRQMLTESLVLAAVSCILGLFLSGLATSYLVKLSGVDFRSFVEVGIDLTVIATILGISILCAVGFGIVPAWLMSSTDSNQVLREGSKGAVSRGSRRFQNALVIGEVALAVFLLIGTALMLQGFKSFRNRDLGYNTDVLGARLSLKDERYSDAESMLVLARELLDRVNALPEVKSAVIAGPGMPTDSWFIIPFYLEDRMSEPDGGRIVLPWHHVTPGYFQAMGIPLLRGREFEPQDTESTTFGIVISREMEQKYWPNGDAIGKRIRLSKRAWFTVIGVVADVEQKALRRDVEWPGPDMYIGMLQYPPIIVPVMNLLVRPKAGIEAAALVPRLREEVRAIAPELPLYDIATIEQRIDDQTRRDRFMIVLMSSFAGIALTLALVGLYGLISYMVAHRKREIGLRMALGASPRDVLGLMVGQGAVLAGIGLAIGLVAALGLNRIFRSLLYGINPNNVLILGGACAVVFAFALSAVLMPARSAMSVEPMKSLRIE